MRVYVNQKWEDLQLQTLYFPQRDDNYVNSPQPTDNDCLDKILSLSFQ